MANSVVKNRSGSIWPLGYVNVPTVGTPVCIMTNVDPSNNNSPNTPTGTNVDEYTWNARTLGIQTYKPNANNNGMIPNTGNVYVMLAPAGNGSGNRTYTGCMWRVIPPGVDLFLPIDPTGGGGISPYFVYLDADNNNDGALVSLYSGMY